jgi:IS5 family transposase
MTDYAIAIYCFLDDFLHKSSATMDKRRKLTDAQMMTTALMAARYFYGNFATAMTYMQEHHGFAKLDKSGFNRHLHRLEKQFNAIFLGMGQALKQLNTGSSYLIDSFPVAVCKNIRLPRCRILQGSDYHGYNASKREYFYGFKRGRPAVQVITTAEGIPVEYFISAGAFADITAFQAMNIDLPAHSALYGDSGYTDYELEDYYQECEQVDLLIQRKSNAKRKDHPALAFLKQHMRKKIESVFSTITDRFPKSIHALTAQGFLLKILLFLFAYACEKAFCSSAT